VSHAPTGPKVALCIGVSQYRGHGCSPLPLAQNDACDVAAALTRCGYDAALLTNGQATLRGMRAALDTFRAKLGAGGVAFFFFSGHGLMTARVFPTTSGGRLAAVVALVAAPVLTLMRSAAVHGVAASAAQLERLGVRLHRAAAGQRAGAQAVACHVRRGSLVRLLVHKLCGCNQARTALPAVVVDHRQSLKQPSQLGLLFTREAAGCPQVA
jgi:hypothetical protein